MKLTLDMSQDIVRNAEIYAKNNQMSVSELVASYLSSISLNKISDDVKLQPITKELAGIIEIDKDTNYKDILTQSLMEKYL
jgi:hypothetical protein